VIEGHELADRGTPRDFAEDEDQGQSLPGRWVNSHELLAGDIIIGRDGRRHRILGISQRFEDSFPVSNLTIGEFHNYAVGPCSILVHNEAVCAAGQDLLQQLFDQGKLDRKQLETILGAGNFTNTKEVIESIIKGVGPTDILPSQMHHFATNKNQTYTQAMEDIANSFGLDLDTVWNKELLPHLGRHPNDYHEFVLRGMEMAAEKAGGNTVRFLELFEKFVKDPVRQNPSLLRKIGWE